MQTQAGAILWAQWKSMLNHFPRKKTWIPISLIVTLVWYALWSFFAYGVFMICRGLSRNGIDDFVGPSLLLALFYWQLIPVLMASTGFSLELKKLIVYPIPPEQLFHLEAVLRLTTAVEMVIVTSAGALGLLLNPRAPFYAPLAILLFMGMNIYVSVGLRDLLTRLLAHKRIREILAIIVVLIAALPQLLVQSVRPGDLRSFRSLPNSVALPWTAAGSLAAGEQVLASAASLLIWTALGYWFGWSQFRRNLRFDAAAANASNTTPQEKPGILESFFRLPSRLFPDPLGGLIEKELRSLSRTPRFRITFIMGFSFGLLIFLPIAFRRGEASTGFFSQHYLSTVSLYSLMLLGDVCVWNVFGFDRHAAQNYFALPLSLRTVLIGKNVAALIWFYIEFLAIVLMCLLFRIPMSVSLFLEAFVLMNVFAVFLLAIGNMISTRNPSPVNPSQSWRKTSAGSVQAYLFLIYLGFAIPIGLAFLARYAFEGEWAFYAVMLVNFLVGTVVYAVALDSALQHAAAHRESLIDTLSGTENPIG
jgi:ABC-2 type transport system permease protein